MPSQVRHFQRYCARFADVTEDDHGTGYLSIPIMNGGGRIANRRLNSVAANKHAIVRQADGPILQEDDLRRVCSGLTCRSVKNVEDLGQPTPGGVFARPAGHRLSHQIQEGHIAQKVSGQYGIADGVERDLSALLSSNRACSAVCKSNSDVLRSLMSS